MASKPNKPQPKTSAQPTKPGAAKPGSGKKRK